jgi:redox-sensing transcriptional repressor
MDRKLPLPSIERLCALYGLLQRLAREGRLRISSRELGELIGETADTVRKDIGRLQTGNAGSAGYEPEALRQAIARSLGLTARRKACIVGLGRLGQAILQYTDFAGEGIEICAGFDSDVNKLELLSSGIPLLPSYRIAEYVRSEGISLAVLAVPPQSAQGAADRLCAGGISGIVNFTTPVAVPQGVEVRMVSVLEEFRVLSVLIEHEAGQSRS